MSAESLLLLIVVAAAVVTAYWAARTIGVDLSFIENAASALGIDGSVAGTHQVGYSEPRVEATPPPTAPGCHAGEQPAYLNGMAALHQQIGGAMGTPLECEHADGALGNTVQQTSAGLATYDSQRNTETFTDGWHHWALTPDGLVAWEGTSAEPTPASAATDDAAAVDRDGGPPQAATVAGDEGASDAVAANQDDASSDAAAVLSDDGASDAVMADTPNDGSSQTAAASGDGGASDVVAASPDDGSPEAVTVSSDDGGSDAVATNQDDASSVTNDDGASDAVMADTQDHGSSQVAAASDSDGYVDAVTDIETGDQP